MQGQLEAGVCMTENLFSKRELKNKLMFQFFFAFVP